MCRAAVVVVLLVAAPRLVCAGSGQAGRAFAGAPPSKAGSSIVADAGRRVQLTRIVDALRSAVNEAGGSIDMLARARTRIEALQAVDETRLAAARDSMRLTKAAALADLRRFEEDRSVPHDRDAVKRRLEQTIARYEALLAPPTRR